MCIVVALICNFNVRIDVSRSKPFTYDKGIHPAEQSEQKQDLRDEFEQEVQCSLKVEAVQSLNDYTQGHLENGKDYCNFHLEIVCVGKELV